MAMARDGLLPSFFSDVNKHTQVPVKSTIASGVGAAGLAFFMDVSELAGMVSRLHLIFLMLYRIDDKGQKVWLLILDLLNSLYVAETILGIQSESFSFTSLNSPRVPQCLISLPLSSLIVFVCYVFISPLCMLESNVHFFHFVESNY